MQDITTLPSDKIDTLVYETIFNGNSTATDICKILKISKADIRLFKSALQRLRRRKEISFDRIRGWYVTSSSET